jgi:hypothetical protein
VRGAIQNTYIYQNHYFNCNLYLHSIDNVYSVEYEDLYPNKDFHSYADAFQYTYADVYADDHLYTDQYLNAYPHFHIHGYVDSFAIAVPGATGYL